MKGKTTCHRLLRMLFICTMLLGLMATAAFATGVDCTDGDSCTHEAAIDGTHYGTLAEAIAAEGTDDANTKITLLKDVELQEQLKINKEITLDLNNRTITATNTGYSSARTLNITAPVIMQNGTLIDTVVSTSKNITMTNVGITIVDDTTDKGSTTNALYLSGGSSTATLNNCNLSLTTTRGSASTAIDINWMAKNSNITMNGGSLTLVKNDGSGYGAGAINTTADNITMTLNGVNVTYKNNSDSYTALNFGSKGGTLTVNGGSITATNIDGTESRDALYAGWNKSSTVNVEGNATINGKIGFAKKGTAVPKINIKGGTFTDEALIRTISEESDPSACLVVTGGNFVNSDANRGALTAAGVEFKEEHGKLVGIDVSTRVAKVGDKYYYNFVEAVGAANTTAAKEIVIVGAIETDIATIAGLVIKTEGANAKLTVAIADGTIKEQIASVFNAVTFENASLVELKHNTDVVAVFGDLTVRDGAVVSGAISRNAMDKEGYYYHPTLVTIASDSGYLEDAIVAGDVLGKHKIVEYGTGTKYIVGIAIKHDGVAYYRVYNKLNDALQFAVNNDSETSQINDTVVLFTNYSDIANYYSGGETYYVSNVGTSQHYATFTLDLNGKTWSSEKQSDELVYMLAITANNTDVTVKNGIITGTNAVYGITTNGMFENITLTLEDLTINVPNGSGMYLPASGDVTMTNVTINAKSVGVQTCAADVTLNNCSITTQGDDRATEKANGDGLIPDGSAVSIVNRPGYKTVPAVTINGGTFNSGTDVGSGTGTSTVPIKAYDWNFSGTAGAQNNTAWTPDSQPATIRNTNSTVSTVGTTEGEWTTFVPKVAKIGDVKYNTLADAIAAVQNNETITLLNDVVIQDNAKGDKHGILTINGEKTITINGDNKTITVAQTTDTSKLASAFLLSSNANVAFKNLTIDANETAKHGINIFGAQATIENVTLKNFTGYGMVVQGTATASALTTENNGWGGVNVDVNSANNSANFTLESGNLNDTNSIIVEHTSADNSLASHATINGGTINGELIIKATGSVTINNGSFNEVIYTYDNSALTINNGTFNEEIDIYDNSKLTINNGSFNEEIDSHDSSIVIIEGGNFNEEVESRGESSMTVNGGTFTDDLNSRGNSTLTVNNGSFDLQADSLDNSSMIINNGTFTQITECRDSSTMIINDGTFSDARDDKDVALRLLETGNLTINGGTFLNSILNDGEETASITITGGTFTEDPSDFVEGGYDVINNDNDTFTVRLHTHVHSTDWKYDTTNHWHECKCGDMIDVATHVFTNTSSRSCDICSYTKSSGRSSVYQTFSITSDTTENGSITVSPKSAKKGSTVTITITPDNGYELDGLTVLDNEGKEVKVTENNGKYTFEMPASKVTIKPSFKKVTTSNPFADVNADDYFFDAVMWAIENGITSGTSATTFSPNESCTRAQIVTFLWRAAGSPEPKNAAAFSDVTADSYYAKAVAWAVENGITSGTGDNKFSPNETCTRGQAVTFLSRALKGIASGDSNFLDVDSDSYYAAAIAWAVENGITNGTSDTTFSPDEDCTRGQIVTLLFRAMAK